MNVFPNEVPRSIAQFSLPVADVNQRTIASSNLSPSGSLNQLSSAEDGDLRKFSGGMTLSQSGPSMPKKMVSLDKTKKPVIKVKKSHDPSGDNSGLKKRQTRKKWKKPKDKPNRPLSAYNLFFQAERATMLGDDAKAHDQDKGQKRIHRKTHGKIGFADMARNIGQKWKDLPEDEKKPFVEQAAKEKDRYVAELDAWKAEQAVVNPSKSLVAALKAEAVEIDTSKTNEAEATLEKTFRSTAQDERVKLTTTTGGINLHSMAMLNQQQQHQKEDYLRALQERRMALLAGRMGMDSSMFQHYPSAAEASANALLSQYQPSSLGAMNSMGFVMGPMGMNNMGMNSMGMNGMGMNNTGMNMRMTSLAASMNMIPPGHHQYGASRLQQQLRADLGGQGLNEFNSAQIPNFVGNPADVARMDEISSQLRNNVNSRFIM
jgi:hypothetical protein